MWAWAPESTAKARSFVTETLNYAMVVVEAINISHYLIFTLITWNVTYYLEMTLENTLDSKEIKAVNPKGNQPWVFTGRTDAEADALIFWPPDVKSQFIRKDPNWKDWRQEEKG